MELFTAAGLTALMQVIAIDLVLAGDNAIVIGLAAAGLPKEMRTRAILVGIIAATVLRIIFATGTTYLMAMTGLLLAGGILLLWVCWKMWRELREGLAYIWHTPMLLAAMAVAAAMPVTWNHFAPLRMASQSNWPRWAWATMPWLPRWTGWPRHWAYRVLRHPQDGSFLAT